MKVEKKPIKNSNKKIAVNNQSKREGERIITDPNGSWTGVCEDDPFETPIQDVDDL